MDVFARGKVQHCVLAPFNGPANFLDFLLDARSDGTVADVGIYLHQEIAPDNHRLALRMIDVRRDDRPTARNFGANKVGSDKLWDAGAERFAPQAACRVVPWSLGPLVPWSRFLAA